LQALVQARSLLMFAGNGSGNGARSASPTPAGCEEDSMGRILQPLKAFGWVAALQFILL
jgi:hypothetical protein